MIGRVGVAKLWAISKTLMANWGDRESEVSQKLWKMNQGHLLWKVLYAK